MFDFIELLTAGFCQDSSVTFCKYAEVVLIIPLKEYKDLWWNIDDLINARITSLTELNILMKRHNISIKLAKRILYQPFGYNKNNFLLPYNDNY
jgi:hypothetical protein